MGVYARIETDARRLEGAGRRRGAAARRARRRVPADRRRAHRPGEERQRQRHPRGARRRHRRRRLAHAQHRHALALRQRAAALQLRQDRACKQGLRWVRQEPNRDTLWNTVKYGSVTPVPDGAVAAGRVRHRQARARCSRSSATRPTTRRTRCSKGNFNVEVYFYPSKPAETIVIIVGQQPSGGTASEA